MKISGVLGAVGLALFTHSMTANAEPLPPAEGRTNLALGQNVIFSPQPNYSLTAKGGTDATDLTDGKTTARPDQMLWFEASSVGWTYPGKFNLAVDLGKSCDIDEVAIRLQNGSPVNGGRMFPGWVEAFVSDDGEHYRKVGEFSQWNPNDFQKFNIGQGRGKSWVDCLRFTNLKTRGRWVGFQIYGGNTTTSDELYVFGAPAANDASAPAQAATSFTVTHPQVYFHKPYLELATNLALPIPVGLSVPAADGAHVTLKLDVPPGVELVSGSILKTPVASVAPVTLPDGWKQYAFAVEKAKTDKVFGNIYLRASGWKNGQTGALRYQFGDANWQSISDRIPLRAVTVPAAPRLKTIMASLGWWNSPAVDWPQQLEAFRVLGLNTYPVFGMWMPRDPKDPQWAKLEEARRQGFFISNIDDAVGKILTAHKGEPEIYDQFEDGTVGTHLCISYRGKFYQEEIQRFSQMMAKIRPDFTSEDIEVWGWAGPTDSMKCTRCLDDYKKSGAGSWAQWQQGKGQEMLRDEITAARKAVQEAGGKPFVTGLYDVRPGNVYQQIFDFDALYPQLLDNSQTSTYTSLQPADIVLIGDEARQDRSRLPRSDLQPWLTPGDSGTFPGESFQWAILECYANGSNGIWFWSSRMWDSEDMIAYNRVLRAIAPVEDVIVTGDLVGASAAVDGAGRISGMKLDNRMLLLAADYFGESDGTLKLRLALPKKSALRDLMTGQTIGKVLPAGKQSVTLPLGGQRARLLEVVPAK
jgi:hypothetical protein